VFARGDGGTCLGHWISRYGTKWPILCWCATATRSRPPHWLYQLPTNTTLIWSIINLRYSSSGKTVIWCICCIIRQNIFTKKPLRRRPAVQTLWDLGLYSVWRSFGKDVNSFFVTTDRSATAARTCVKHTYRQATTSCADVRPHS